MSLTILQRLQSFGLEGLIHKFEEYGVNESNLCNLQFQDYDQMGIVEPPLRQKLFRLVQAAKREGPPPPQPSAPSQPASSSASSLAPTQVLPSRNNPSSSNSQIPGPSQPPKKVIPVAAAPAPVKKIVTRVSEPAPIEDVTPPPQAARNPSRRVSTDPMRQQQQAPAPIQPPPVQHVEDEDDEGGIGDGDEIDEDDEDGESGMSNYGDDIPKIRVAVRKRPLNSKEKNQGQNDVASVSRNGGAQITIHEPKQKVDLTKYVESHKFCFDEVFDENSTNEEIYGLTCKPLVQFFMNKGKATCFAYGQTGSGKTFTMMGSGEEKGEGMGLYALAARDMFRAIASSGDKYSELQVWVSFFEIYGGKLFDLLNDRKKLVMREDGQRNVNIVGLRERKCAQVSDLLELMAYGNAVRSTGSTGANIDSSRSHAILQIVLKKPSKTQPLPGQPAKMKLKMHGKFSFIDLAGSERAADTSNNDRRTRLEGAEINKSLLALKECIRALDQGGKHLPFRGSQLTQVLKDSFMGNSKTMMIANISPNSGSCEHTLNTLRYADRVKELKKGPGGGGPQGGPKNYDAYMPHQGKQGKRTYDTEGSSGGNGLASAYQPEKPSQLQPPINQLKQPNPISAIPKPASNRNSGNSGPDVASKPFVKPLAAVLKSSASSVVDDVVDDLQKTHVDLCSTILREEESIVEAHRGQIDSTMKGVKEEMELLKKFDTKGIDVDEYVDRLDELLTKKMTGITDLKNKLLLFKKHLKQEEELSSSFNRQKNGLDPSSWSRGYDDDDDAPPPNNGGGYGGGRSIQPSSSSSSSAPRDPSYPHLHPLPNANYR